MPKYYCDYCDCFLTHDSPSVRKSHNDGWKHKAAVKMYFAQFEEDWVQKLIDTRLREYEQRAQRPPMQMPMMMPPGGPPMRFPPQQQMGFQQQQPFIPPNAYPPHFQQPMMPPQNFGGFQPQQQQIPGQF